MIATLNRKKSVKTRLLKQKSNESQASPLRKTLQAKTDVSGQIGPIVSITSYSKQPAWRPESYAPLVRRDPGAMAEETTKT
ncbi:hypothetical protein M513_12808 [Trichuris suis]|uniref:Uncharacterized protein n=1 Tax=Trichuris suis TaxID=68888 RepID=A0A085LMY4_9BILA|nr:hypothetical protein M513_12808 [Trichuris suis]